MTKDEADALLHKFAIECRFGTQDSCASAAIPILTALIADPPNCGELEGTPAYEWGFSAGKAWEKARKAAIASEAGEWMPIESAPKFVEVLVTGFDMNDPRADRHYAVAINGHDGWIQSQDLGICTPLEFLTHWMPIQPAPTGESHE